MVARRWGDLFYKKAIGKLSEFTRDTFRKSPSDGSYEKATGKLSEFTRNTYRKSLSNGSIAVHLLYFFYAAVVFSAR